MSLFSFWNKASRFFTAEESERIIAAIREAEVKTSGEIRIYIESRCRHSNPVDRAAEIFWNLKMDHTSERNGVLLYLATRDHKVAIWGDEGIHKVAGPDFWNRELSQVIKHFRNNAYSEGMILAINDIGKLLQEHFPYKPTTDKNELPDDIVFGN